MRLFINGEQLDLNTNTMILAFDDDDERLKTGIQILSFKLIPNQVRLFGVFPKDGDVELRIKQMDDVFDRCHTNTKEPQ